MKKQIVIAAFATAFPKLRSFFRWHVWLFGLAVGSGGVVSSHEAAAQIWNEPDPGCRFATVNNVFDFGNISPDTGATMSWSTSVECGGLNYFKACLSVDVFMGAAEGGNRILIGNAGNIVFSLVDPLTNKEIISLGDSRVEGSVPEFSMAMTPPMSQTVPVTITGKINAGQVIPTGAYQAVSLLRFWWTAGSQVPATCNQGGLMPTVTVPVTIRATVEPECKVEASDIDFGSHMKIRKSLTAVGALNITCSVQLPYKVNLSTADGLPATRKQMKNGADYIEYGLYQDAAHTMPWDADKPLNGIGTGVGQTVNVYALVPEQRTPAAGTYIDTVTVSVDY